MDDTVILIPVRLQATRFPNKPFAKIGNLPMLHYVYNSAAKFFSNVYLAICDQTVEEYCVEHNIQYIMTDSGHVSGSDRIGEAIEILENQKDFKFIINLQGDMPFIKEEYNLKLLYFLTPFKTTVNSPLGSLSSKDSITLVIVFPICSSYFFYI